MSSEAISNGSWTSPSTVGKFIAQVGLPAVLLVVVLTSCFLVVTGLLPTPLMDSLQIIKQVRADQEEQSTILSDIRKVNITTCELIAKDKDEAKRCQPQDLQTK